MPCCCILTCHGSHWLSSIKHDIIYYTYGIAESAARVLNIDNKSYSIFQIVCTIWSLSFIHMFVLLTTHDLCIAMSLILHTLALQHIYITELLAETSNTQNGHAKGAALSCLHILKNSQNKHQNCGINEYTGQQDKLGGETNNRNQQKQIN